MATILPDIKIIIHKYIARVRKEKQVIKAYLYGSHAKGTAGKWSDIDVAIVSPDFSEDLFEERVGLMKMAMMIDERIEPSPFRPEDFTSNNPLVNQINTSGVIID